MKYIFKQSLPSFFVRKPVKIMPCKAEHKTQEVNCSVLSERVFSAEWSGHFFAVLQMMCDTAKLY